MPRYEYKVVPAPSKGTKAKGVKTPESRFALSIETTLNQMGAEGWEYLRAELLPSDERSGLTGSTVNWRNVLVFRRAVEAGAEDFAPRVLDLPAETSEIRGPAAPAPTSAPIADPPLHVAEPADTEDEAEETDTAEEPGGIGAALKARARLAGVRRDDGAQKPKGD
ncbi:DUF4177 domain-containing protein [Pseudodonghicola flavimaris]|uniref:DUF4177 domain-containing protein n=1 Tax=Pseudodonghicola flavimaris TaxID=3050036 RepID=A0ABT7F026_9RHOB|nr:DUF4177 domain-containing protein [Pseudodonghicola flavimaris]MDK3017958.1 DUF4177 domain-containing protein [Pseudodonghicola flavimaris]